MANEKWLPTYNYSPFTREIGCVQETSIGDLLRWIERLEAEMERERAKSLSRFLDLVQKPRRRVKAKSRRV